MSKDKVALVTGANRGIGLEVVRQLAEQGFTVILGSRSKSAGENAAKQLNQATIIAKQLDITNQDSVNELANWLKQNYDHLDVLVNNAGMNYDTYQNVINADLRNVQGTFETNILGAWRVTQAVLPLLKKSQQARVVNVSSGAGALASMTGGTPAYSLSKLALNGLTMMLANQLKSTGILVNAVCPGWVATDMGGAGGRAVELGGKSVVWAVNLPADGPTGKFLRDGKEIDW